MSRTDKAPTPAPAAAPGRRLRRPPARRGPAAQTPMRIPRPTGGPGRGGPFAGMNIPAEKAMNFWPSARRLLGELRPERLWLTLVLVLAVVSVTFSVIGPRLLGEGTNLIFAGVVSKQLPPGVTQAQVIAQLRAAGQTQQADMLSAMTLTRAPGSTSPRWPPCCCGRWRCTCWPRRSAGCRRTSSTASCSAPCSGCASGSRRRSTSCRCATSIPCSAASCSAG